MKHLIGLKAILFLLLMPVFTNAQVWMEDARDNSGKINFFKIQENFKEYGKTVDLTKKSSGYKPYKRWEHYWESRVDENGHFPSAGTMEKSWKSYLKSNPSQLTRSLSANWVSEGPTSNPGGYSGLGRINAIAFDPLNSNIIWAGAPSGGLWKSTDTGMTWTTSTDNFQILGVSGIAIHPTDPDTMYIATGDGDAGDNPSIGVLKSTDGGVTWNTTGLTWTESNGRRIRKILMDPNDVNTLMVATSIGLYITTDGGLNWTNQVSGNFYDIEAHPTASTNIFYASKNDYGAAGDIVYKSTDNGSTWTQKTTVVGKVVGRSTLAISAASPNTVYLMLWDPTDGDGVFGGLYKSTDSGENWTLQSTTPCILANASDGSNTGNQGWYDFVLTADPTNADVLYAGGVALWKSLDGGVTWALSNFWFNLGNGTPTVHADKHALEWQNNTTLWSGNDGGVYMTNDGGTSWDYRSEGMAISQIYRLSASQTDNKVIMGLQDNGTKLKNISGAFSDEIGGDGMECIIDPTNSSRMFGAIQQGELRRTLNGGNSWQDIQNNIPGTPEGAWVTPYALDPVNPTTLYAGFNDLWKSTDSGDSWTNIGAAIGATNNVNVAPSNPDYIYAGSTSSLMKTTDGGSNWTAVSMPGNSTRMLEIHPTNPDILWAVRQNYSSGQKVYKSIDGGVSWTNISGTLPNLPANCIIYDKNSTGGLYVGMDIGIYYRDDSMSDWELFSNGIANVEVWDLSINYMEQRIYAATYGRGLWSSNLKDVNFIVSGEKSICPDLDWTYTVDNVPTATNYIWTLPSGWTGSSSTHTIDVDPSSTSGIIQCEVVIPTGNRTYTLAVSVNANCETAINFDGVDDYAQISNGAVDVSNSSFTVEFWTKRTALAENDYVTSQGNTGANVNLHIGFRSTNSFTFAFYSNDLNASSAFTDLQWHHWACVYDNSISSPDHNRFIYRDGILVASDRATADYSGTGSLMIGRFGNHYMGGDLDEFRVWNTARTQSEIEANLHCVITNPPASLIAYLPFEDGVPAGDNVFNFQTTDFSGNDNDALLNNLLMSGATSNFVDGTKPKSVVGPDVVCPDLVWEFSVPQVDGATSYTWSLPSGWSGSSSTKSIDVSSSTNSGTITCTVVASCGSLVFTKAVTANSECGNSLDFDGVDDYVQFSDNSIGNFGTGEFTIEYWVKTTDDKGAIVAKRDACDCDNWSALIENGRIRLEISDDGCTSGITNVYGVSQVDDGNWHHIAFTRVGTVIYGYVDGNLEVKGTSAHDMTSTNSLRLGNIPCSSSWHLDGSIDEVRIWNVARTQTEIQENMFGLFTASNANLQLYMPFEDGLLEGDNSGFASTLDHSANKLFGTYTNMAMMGTSSNLTYDVDIIRYLDADMDGFGISGTTTTDFNQSGSYSMLDGDCNDGDNGINPCAKEICGNSIDDDCDGNTDVEMNRALDLNGGSDRINIPTLAHTSSFTFEAWIKVNSTSTGTQLITEWYGTNRADVRIHEDGYLTYRENGGGFTYSATDLRDDTWHHIAVTHDGYAGNNLKLYLDGVNFRTLSFSTVVTSNLNTIGSDRNGGNPLLGAIDDVRFWDIALTEQQIQDRMNMRLDGTESNLVRYYPMDQGIPDGNNSGVVMAKDWTSGSQDGTLIDVALTGTSSNWVAGKPYTSLYPDSDNDNFGGSTAWSCGSMTGFVENNLDCDDSNNAINPLAMEICGNGIDDNCDGQTDIETNKALDFHGSDNSRIVLPVLAHSEFFSVEMWIKMGNNLAHDVLVEWNEGGGVWSDLRLWGNNRIAYVENGSGNYGGPDLGDNEWHHIALVHDGYGSGNIRLYVDGEIVVQSTRTAVINATHLTIGANSGAGGEFTGQIDDIRFWDAALTHDQITSRKDIRLDGDEPNLVRYYPLDNGIPESVNTLVDMAIDKTANAAHGTLTSFALTGTSSNWVNGRSYPTLYLDGDMDGFGGSTTWTCGSMDNYYYDNSDCNDSQMAIGPAALEICGNGVDENCNGNNDENSLSLSLDGSNDVVNLGNTLGNFGTNDFTIEARIKTVDADDFIISKRPACGCENFWNMMIDGDGKLRMEMYEDNSCGNGGSISGSTIISDGQWHHVAFVRKDFNVFIIVDGVVENSTTRSTNLDNTADLIIGNNPCGARYKGEIDELRIWNVARPFAALKNMKDVQVDVNHSDLLGYYDFNTPLAVGEGNNTGITTLVDVSGNGHDGTLSGFALSGTTSNYLNNPGTTMTWYADTDSDTYGDPNVSQESCSQPTGYVADNTDCDDTNNAINPGVSEIAGNSIDDDCDGGVDEEASIQWILLDDDVNGSCTSNTDCCTNIYCFGLEYTPGANGTLAAYTSGFFVDCIGGSNPVISNSSCIMTDNSSETAECGGPGTVLINASGNNGSTAITVETPIIIHQVCITIPANSTINLTEDIVTDISVSIDLDSGGAIDEFPTFTATSASGNTPPVLTMGMINSCYTDLAAAEAAAIAATSATDDCDSSVDLTASTVGTCSAVITVTGTDDCGLTSTVTYNTAIDGDGPTADALTDITDIKCISDVPAADINIVMNEADNCGGSVTVSHEGDTNNSGTGCAASPYVVTRTYRLTDGCGNTTDLTQTITVIDDVAPTADALTDITGIKCIADVPAADINLVMNEADNCGGSVTVTHEGDTNNSGTGCAASPYVVTRTYRLTDGCGNTTDLTQTITVIDDVAPTADALTDITGIKCIADVPAADINLVMNEADNCGGSVTVSHEGDTNNSGSGCAASPYIVTRTYRLTDGCGNTTDLTQTITVIDDVAPTADALIDITGIKCIADVPAADINLVMNEADNCGGSVTVSHEGDTNNSGTGCAASPYVVTRTYRLTDGCGNTTDLTQTITVIDDVAPTADALTDITGIKCIADVPAADINLVMNEADNCGGSVTVTYEGDTNNGGTGCAASPYVVTRTYRLTDGCGNTTDLTQTITVIDDVAPTADALTDITGIKCIADVPAADVNIVMNEADNCGGSVTVTHEGDTNNSGTGCAASPYIVTRTYRLTDGCGNTTDLTQTITVIDDVAPTADALTDITGIKCISDVPAADINIVMNEADNCGGSVTVSHEGDTNNSGTGCAASPYIVTRTYRLTDACGNTTDLTQTITVIDDVAPTADAMTDITGIKCISDVPAADINLVMNEADNCGGSVTVSHEGDTNNSGTGCAASPYIVTRTYRLTDACGNTTDLTQTITVIDDVAPTADAMTDITGIKCIADVPAADINLVVNEADNCGGSVTVTHEGDTNNSGTGCAASPYVVTRTYRLTDGCGNTTDLTQTITVIDDVAPTADALTDITGIKCISDVPAADVNVVMNEADNCGGSVTVSHEGDTNNSGTGCAASPYIVTRTYRLTDACGNTSDLSQTITVIDDEAPVITGSITTSAIQGCDASAAPAAETTISGLEGLDGDLDVMDGCTAEGSLTITHSDSPSGSCPLTITRTYTIKDACDNSSTVDHIITVNDTTAPVLVMGTIEACYLTLAEAITAAEGATTHSDNCSGSVTIASTSSGTCPTEIVVKGTDVCGNVDSVTYSVVITNGAIPAENGGPVAIDSSIQVALDAVPPAILPEIVDVCGNVLAPSAPVLGGTYQTGDCIGTITYTYTYVDCANTSLDWTFTYNLSCQKINIRGLVEGAYEATGDSLRTDYNNLHLLPGQDKLLSGNISVIIGAEFTPFGQPYQVAPWNYTGNLGDTFGEASSPNAPANVVEYPDHVFDWVLVTIRENGIEAADNIFQCAGWLHKDGEISFPETCPDDFNINTGSDYYVVLEHRNHLAVLDTATIMDSGAYIDIDFSLQDSYAPIFRQGQVEMETGVFGMYGANTDQVLSRVSINSVDRTNWKIDQNKIGYYKGDINQNVSTNSEDETKWKQNQNTTSGIKFD